MPRGKAGPKPDALDETHEEQAPLEPVEPRPEPIEQVYECDACDMSGTWEEWNEHGLATGHAVFSQHDKEPATPEQTALFSEPGKVYRHLRTMISEERRHELNQQLADLYRQMIEQKELAELSKERAKGFEAEMLPIGAKLRDPYELRAVECRWEIVLSANAKELAYDVAARKYHGEFATLNFPEQAVA